MMVGLRVLRGGLTAALIMFAASVATVAATSPGIFSGPTGIRFARPAPRSGTESAAAHDDEVEEYLHVALANRGILITPFHNMALMAPSTTRADVDAHTAAFAEVVAAIC